jgi:hypothetical protein
MMGVRQPLAPASAPGPIGTGDGGAAIGEPSWTTASRGYEQGTMP